MKVYTHKSTSHLSRTVYYNLEAALTNDILKVMKALQDEIVRHKGVKWTEIDTRNTYYNPPYAREIKTETYVRVYGERGPTASELIEHKKARKASDEFWTKLGIENAKDLLQKHGFKTTKSK